MTPPQDALIEAQALNVAQARAIYNPSEEIDSALEHLIAAARLTDGPAQAHILAAAEHLTHTYRSNSAERQLEREAAGQVKAYSPRDPYGLKTLAGKLRAPLANVANPTTSAPARAASESIVRSVLADCPPERVGDRDQPNVGLRHELGVRKYEALLQLVEGVPV